MLRSYLLINSDQEELLKYESFKLEVFRYIVLFLSSLGTFKLCTWLSFLYKTALKNYHKSKIQLNSSRRNHETKQDYLDEECFKPELFNKQQKNQTIPIDNVLDLNNVKVSSKPSPESIMGIAAAAATAASVFMTKKRENSKQRDGCCGKCCALKTKHSGSSC